MEMTDPFPANTALPPGGKKPVLTEYKTGWTTKVDPDGFKEHPYWDSNPRSSGPKPNHTEKATRAPKLI